MTTYIRKLLDASGVSAAKPPVNGANPFRPEPVPAPVRMMGVDVHAMREKTITSLETANKRRQSIADEIERLQGELANTDKAIEAANAALNVLGPIMPPGPNALKISDDEFIAAMERAGAGG